MLRQTNKTKFLSNKKTENYLKKLLHFVLHNHVLKWSKQFMLASHYSFTPSSQSTCIILESYVITDTSHVCGNVVVSIISNKLR